jgi:hypothetical protein
VSLSIVALLAITEVALRILGIGYGNPTGNGHPIFHHWHPASYKWHAWGPHNQWGGFDLEFNTDGCCMRDEIPPGNEPSILFLGDSFTEATQVQEDDRFVSLVAKECRMPVVNFGCSSFTPLLSRLQLIHFQSRLCPAAVVLQLWNNDIDDDIEYRAVAHRDSSGNIDAVPGTHTSWWVTLGRKSYLARLVRKGWVTLKRQREWNARSGAYSSLSLWKPAFTKKLEDWYSDEERVGIETSILEIGKWCRERDCHFLLFVVPDRGALREGKEDFFEAYFAKFAKTHGIRYVDVVASFRNQPLEALYFPEDIHLTPKGHLLVSAAIWSALRPLLR